MFILPPDRSATWVRPQWSARPYRASHEDQYPRHQASIGSLSDRKRASAYGREVKPTGGRKRRKASRLGFPGWQGQHLPSKNKRLQPVPRRGQRRLRSSAVGRWRSTNGRSPGRTVDGELTASGMVSARARQRLSRSLRDLSAPRLGYPNDLEGSSPQSLASSIAALVILKALA